MSSTTKTIIALIVLILVILAGWTWYELSLPSPTVPETSTVPNTAPATTMQPATQAPATTVDQDVTSIDAQINGLNADSANLSN